LAKSLNEILLDSKLEILPGVGHMSNMEAPEKFNALLESFLSGISGKGL